MQSNHHQIKIIGQNGQLSLGKNYAGQVVSVDYDAEDHVWVIKAGEFVPESQKWLHTEENLDKINRALKFAAQNAARDNFDEMCQEIEHDAKRKTRHK